MLSLAEWSASSAEVNLALQPDSGQAFLVRPVVLEVTMVVLGFVLGVDDELAL